MNASTFSGGTPAQPPARLVIASRESRLAMWQAEHVQARLQALYPNCDVSILGMTTRGDQILDKTLSKIGGKGLFVKELETALAEGRADLAVHSLKDVPMVLPEGFALTAVMEREDPRDALVAPQGSTLTSLDELPPGAIVGTSSLRREAMVRGRYPHLQVNSLRGNLDTRLGKLDRGDYAVIILAASGLKRLGLGHRISAFIDADVSLPAAGQGALGIEIAAGRPDVAAWLAPLHHTASAYAVEAERMVSRLLGGSCEVPIAAFADWDKDGATLRMRARVSTPDGTRVLEAGTTGAPATSEAAESMGRQVGEALIAQGAQDIVSALTQASVRSDGAAAVHRADDAAKPSA